jgi:hypothetical protein
MNSQCLSSCGKQIGPFFRKRENRQVFDIEREKSAVSLEYYNYYHRLAHLYSLIQTTCHLGETLVYNFYEI